MPASKAAAKLNTYRAKRDFTRTKEPAGETKVETSPQLRFVIQKHAATRLHYDLRLELDGVFKSWAVTRGPSLNPADKRLAVEVEDHPLDYGDFEGTIPKGEYGGGTVLLWDRGFWAPEGGMDPQKALKKGELKFVMAGERMQGSWVLVRLKPKGNEKRNNWLLIKHRDDYAKTRGDITKEDTSVASGRSMDKIEKGEGAKPKPFMLKKTMAADAVWHSHKVEDKAPRAASKPAPKTAQAKSAARMPNFVEPQLCKLVDKPPSGPGWVHEIKLDGYRIQMRVKDGDAILRTRKGLDWTETFPEIAAAGEGFADCIIDGEICALDKDGAPSFSGLQDALSTGDTAALVFYVFDLLFFDGADLRALPLSERKAQLEKLVDDGDGTIRYIPHVKNPGADVHKAACDMNMEGIVSKKLDAPYRSGRGDVWQKSKCRNGQEIVIGGWTEAAGRFKSLLAGVHRKGKLVYVGRIGTGYGRNVVSRLVPELKKNAAKTSPFEGDAAPHGPETIRWAKPTLIAEVEFAGWTGDGSLRQAAFKGLRQDKPAKEIVQEKAMSSKGATKSVQSSAKSAPAQSAASKGGPMKVLGVAISHPEKILWPETDAQPAATKADLANYFEAVAERILPHIKGRPCSIIRTPDGIEGQSFFQRHAGKGSSELITEVKVRGDKEAYIQFDSAEALIAAAQSGATELHPWNCQPNDPETPGRLVFDLDPAPDVDFSAVIDGAKEIRDRLAALGMTSFCKTTGGKGLHVVAPLAKPKKGELRWPEAKGFAQELCRQMAAESPDRYLINMAKKARAGKIFLDYLRNDRTSTAVAPYSPRARPGAPVSMPIAWSQVRKGLDPQKFNIRTVPALLKKPDPWADYCDVEADFVKAGQKLLSK